MAAYTCRVGWSTYALIKLIYEIIKQRGPHFKRFEKVLEHFKSLSLQRWVKHSFHLNKGQTCFKDCLLALILTFMFKKFLVLRNQ